MRVEELKNGKAAWTRFLKANGGGILQSYEWGDFRNTLGWTARHIVVRDGTSIRLAAMTLEKPLPFGHHFFYIPEGPVVKGGDWHDKANQQAFIKLHEFLQKLGKREKALFLKIDPHILEQDFPTDWLSQIGFSDSPEDIQAAVVTEVDLTPKADDILAGMKQKGRYNVRYAARKGVKVRESTSAADLDEFYRLLESTAQRQGISYRDKAYFESFRKHFMEGSDYAAFFIAEAGGEPVAAILVTFFGDEAIYLYGGSSPKDRNIQASYLVQWEAMKAAKRRGAKRYNMTGIAATNDPNEAWAGLRQFKLKFGGQEVFLIGARDFRYEPLRYFLFTQADRVRRLIAKRSGR